MQYDIGPQVILFDLDDTIIASHLGVEMAWEGTCRHFAPQVNEGDVAALNAEIRTAADWFWGDEERSRRGRLDLIASRTEIIAIALRRFGVDNPALSGEMARMRTVLHDEAVQPFPGALDTLRRLREAGVRLGMVTNGAEEAQTAKIARYGLRPYFDAILIEGAFGTGKPDPRVFRHVLAQLDCPASRAWMVGDSLSYDIAPVQALGILAIWHDYRGLGLPAGAIVQPDRIISSLAKLV